MLYLITILFINIYWPAVNYNIELVSHISSITDNNSSSNFGVSDVWGYTDEFGNEYAIVGYRYGTFIYDISTNPQNPTLVADFVGPSNGDYYFHRDYKTFNNHLYIVNEMSGIDVGMQIIDLSPLPEYNPIKRNTYTGITQSHNLWIDTDRGYAFIEKNYPENIHIVDLFIPDVPVHNASFNYWDGTDCHDIYTINNIAYVSEGYSHQFGIYDVNDILFPVHLASIPSFGYAHNAWLNSTGTHLITGEETVGMTVKIWDIQNINNINLVGEYLGENALAHNVHVKNDFIYISHYTTGLKIVDIFNPNSPVEVAAYDTYPDDDNEGFYGCWGAYPFTANNYVYASDMQYGLFILEFNDINAGWVYGLITDVDGPLSDVEIRSLLNGKTFESDGNGEFEFGFPEGEHEFEIISSDNTLIHIENISILPHQTIQHNIIIGLFGDINGDGYLNILDIVLIVNMILAGEFGASADINGDSELNVLDIIQLINLILS